MDRRRFEQLVDLAIQELPDEFRKRLKNVAVMVERRPSAELLDRMGVPPEETLFGLYEGTPLTERGFEAPLYPDCIWIFQEPIEKACESEEEMKEEIRVTIIHEIAHFFGIGDEDLEEMGY